MTFQKFVTSLAFGARFCLIFDLFPNSFIIIINVNNNNDNNNDNNSNNNNNNNNNNNIPETRKYWVDVQQGILLSSGVMDPLELC